MQVKIQLFRTVVVAAMGIILVMGCASSPVAPPASRVQPSGVFVQQVPMTIYMRSQVGTPNELSPIAPAQARNIQKVGNHWTCELNGQAMMFNDATSCWEPQQQ